MRAHHVIVDHDFAKPPERVFEYMVEHENLAELFGAKVTRLQDGRDGERNGVGSVRQLKIGPAPPFEETVTEFERPSRIVYRITKGSPLRGHVGVMTFEPDGRGGTHLHYDIRLASPIPGLAAIVRASLTRSVNKGLATVDQNA
ncbi:MAG TPA: SRPBCC family protein [Solirubrobacteraceae bacterium]|nr:SRPBCC family protein [Solirubrobacteraceae bacterium]